MDRISAIIVVIIVMEIAVDHQQDIKTAIVTAATVAGPCHISCTAEKV